MHSACATLVTGNVYLEMPFTSVPLNNDWRIYPYFVKTCPACLPYSQRTLKPIYFLPFTVFIGVVMQFT